MVVEAGCGFQDCDRTTTTHGQQRVNAIDLDRGSGVKQFHDFFLFDAGVISSDGLVGARLAPHHQEAPFYNRL